MSRLPRRVVAKTCSTCGDSWSVPLSLAHSKQRWRKGGYNMIDAHTAGLRSMSTAYMSYLGDEKRRRDGQRDAAVQLGVALNRCPRCQSEAHVVSRTRWVREP